MKAHLTWHMTVDSTWPQGDWRNTYFCPGKSEEQRGPRRSASPARSADNSWPNGVALHPQQSPTSALIIPGLRKRRNVEGQHRRQHPGPLPPPSTNSSAPPLDPTHQPSQWNSAMATHYHIQEASSVFAYKRARICHVPERFLSVLLGCVPGVVMLAG